MDLLDCVKDAEKWDALEFSDPHFTSAYYRAWKKVGLLASSCGCAKPFLFQDHDMIGNAYNFGGTVAFAPLHDLYQFRKDFDNWRSSNHFMERCSISPWSTDGYPMSVDIISMYVTAKPNVYIDLTEPYDFRQTTKHAVKKAEKNRVSCEIVEATPENAGVFEDMYHQAMRSKGAKNHWFYYPGFFYEVLRELGPKRAVLFFTKMGTDLLCACIVLYGSGTAYYHWAARAAQAPDVGASHYQVWSVANWARWQFFKRLHLGGGVEKDDSLFTFKSGFSPKTVPVFSYDRT